MKLKFLKVFKNSIKQRVVAEVSLLIASAIVLITLMISYLSYSTLNSELHRLLENETYDIKKRLEQRLDYLIESSILLSKNEFVINSLIDKKSREKYLRPLINNYMKGKDVISVSVVDFDGGEIFKTQKVIPNYNSSKELRASLALGQTKIYIDNSFNLILITPIYYYSTTQGALITHFNIDGVGNQLLSKDEKSNFIKLYFKDKVIYQSSKDFKDKEYEKYKIFSYEDINSLLHKLGVDLEYGIEKSIYTKPIKESIIRLLLVGFLFIIAGLIIANILANSITEPIIKLYNRVKSSTKTNPVLCSPIGTHDEIESLAKAFDERTLSLQYEVEHDNLTSLPNRVLLLDRLNQALRHTKKRKDKLALLFLDLDNFKAVNDSLGHSFGDKLLKNVSILLSSSIKSDDTVARLGGDEFVILVENIKEKEESIQVTQNIMKRLQKIQSIEGHNFFISCSIGISLYPNDGDNSEDLIKNADAAMYRAKALGKNNYQFYSKEMSLLANERLNMELKIRNAIENSEFLVYFQPQVSLTTEKIIGFEALVRWKCADNIIPPYKFIPLAEEIGLIESIDKIVMRKAMHNFVKLKNMGYNIETLSLNVSMMQLNSSTFFDDLEDMLADTKMDIGSLILEITETQVMKNVEGTILVLKRLKSMGITIAVDDFGTGQSSLSYLKRLPIDKIKIDQSFIRDLTADKDDLELTRAIIAISKSLNMEIIAEGVETKEQKELLIKEGCFEAQGYYYFKPLCFEDIKDILKNS